MLKIWFGILMVFEVIWYAVVLTRDEGIITFGGS